MECARRQRGSKADRRGQVLPERRVPNPPPGCAGGAGHWRREKDCDLTNEYRRHAVECREMPGVLRKGQGSPAGAESFTFCLRYCASIESDSRSVWVRLMLRER